jgi:ribosome-associated protein
MTKSDNTIKLDQFLKFSGVVMTGGEAKLRIQDGEVLVNGTLETRRGTAVSIRRSRDGGRTNF